MLLGEQNGDLSGMARRTLSRGLSFRGREDSLEVLLVVEPDFSHAVVALIATGREVDGVFLEPGKPLDERRVLLEPPTVKRLDTHPVRSFENAYQFVQGAPPSSWFMPLRSHPARQFI